MLLTNCIFEINLKKTSLFSFEHVVKVLCKCLLGQASSNLYPMSIKETHSKTNQVRDTFLKKVSAFLPNDPTALLFEVEKKP